MSKKEAWVTYGIVVGILCVVTIVLNVGKNWLVGKLCTEEQANVELYFSTVTYDCYDSELFLMQTYDGKPKSITRYYFKPVNETATADNTISVNATVDKQYDIGATLEIDKVDGYVKLLNVKMLSDIEFFELVQDEVDNKIMDVTGAGILATGIVSINVLVVLAFGISIVISTHYWKVI